jgi:hypothetical protein
MRTQLGNYYQGYRPLRVRSSLLQLTASDPERTLIAALMPFSSQQQKVVQLGMR